MNATAQRKSRGLAWLWLALLVFIADWGSKVWIVQHFSLGQSMEVMPSINFYYAQNPGAAFSFLADKGGWQRWLFAVIALVIICILIVMLYRNPVQARLANGAYALVIGGALGNLFDRLIHGKVIDFIDFYIGNWHFPTFNLADSAICIGAALLIIDSLFSRPNHSSSQA